MAFTPIAVQNQSLTFWKNAANLFLFSFLTPTGTPLDISGWYLIALSVYTQVNGENCLFGVLTLTGTDVFASPVSTFTVPESLMTSLNALPSGNYSYVIQGNPVEGDDVQTVASGTLTLVAQDDFTPDT